MIDESFDIKLKVEEILADSGFSDQRAAKMDVDDLLKYVITNETTCEPIPHDHEIGYSRYFTTQEYISHSTSPLQ